MMDEQCLPEPARLRIRAFPVDKKRAMLQTYQPAKSSRQGGGGREDSNSPQAWAAKLGTKQAKAKTFASLQIVLRGSGQRLFTTCFFIFFAQITLVYPYAVLHLLFRQAVADWLQAG